MRCVMLSFDSLTFMLRTVVTLAYPKGVIFEVSVDYFGNVHIKDQTRNKLFSN